ncbi:hypothetical protein HDV00_000296 [Rhizophlyctis rosea]|nr:hypothetical protein HDV00_000296 [Rhizophlyctis rosea]
MGPFLAAVRQTLPELISIATLVNAFDEIGILSYYDYDDCFKQRYKWSGWHSTSGSLAPLKGFASGLLPEGGYDTPEAAKTAASKLLEVASPDHELVVIWYADAPPHSLLQDSENAKRERSAIPKEHWDWIKVTRLMKEQNITVFPILNMTDDTATYYTWMSLITGGKTFVVEPTTATMISTATINLLVGLLGAPYEQTPAMFGATVLTYSANTQHSPQLDMSTAMGEKQPGKLLLKAQLSKNRSVEILPLQSIATTTNTLLSSIHTDEPYCAKVYTIFADLLTPQNILALTRNKLFGLYWREICKRRKDPRREELLAQISRTISVLTGADKITVQAWLDASYNKSEEIKEFIASISPAFPALVAGPTKEDWKAQELLEITYSCNSKVLSRVSHLISELQVLDSPPDASPPDTYIPLAMKNTDLFSHLYHIMCPGLSVSLRPAFLIACVAYMTGHTVLAPRAQTFLTRIRGKWFDAEITENYALAFVKFVLKVDARFIEANNSSDKGADGILTPSEREEFQRLRTIGGLLVNGNRVLKLEQPRGALKNIRPDFKRVCLRCGHKRSFTMMAKDDICGLCRAEDGDLEYGKGVPEPHEGDQSCWCECRSCKGHYTVVRPHLLTNLFVDPSRDAGVHDDETFVCPPCAGSGSAVSPEEIETSLKDVWEDTAWRATVCDAIGVEVPQSWTQWHFLQGKTLFVAKDIITTRPISNTPMGLLTYNKKPVLNTSTILISLLTAITSASSELGLCTLCFEDTPHHNLHHSCGRRGCTSIACTSCLDAWYGGIKPGSIIITSHLSCPFCKRAPTAKTIVRHNRQACELLKGDGTMDPGWVYAWCRRCYKAKQFVERACGGHVEDVEGWRCEECEALDSGGQTHKPKFQSCPRCDVTTEKLSGCDHITCTNCQSHWCWRCGKEFDGGIIYEHMGTAHGGIYGDEFDDFDDEEDFDDY